MNEYTGLLAVVLGLEAELSVWWLTGAALLGVFVGSCVFNFSSPHRKLKEAAMSATVFGALWGAAVGTMALIALNLTMGKVLTPLGFLSSVSVMTIVASLFSLGALSFAERFQKAHPHRVRTGLGRRLKI